MDNNNNEYKVIVNDGSNEELKILSHSYEVIENNTLNENLVKVAEDRSEDKDNTGDIIRVSYIKWKLEKAQEKLNRYIEDYVRAEDEDIRIRVKFKVEFYAGQVQALEDLLNGDE